MTTKIAFANTLKSVDDVRTFEKLAQTIAKTNKYEVNIIGNQGKKESDHKSIHFHQNPVNRKSLVGRLKIRWKTLRLLLKIKPDILVIGTHELLGVAAILKVLRGTPVVYDVRENYKKNALHLSSFPILLRQVIANTIRFKELISRLYIDAYWLAESCYFDELNFVKKRSAIIENKAQKVRENHPKNSDFSILFSGSISHYSEVLLAVDCFTKMQAKTSAISLKIIGQYHDEKLRNQLEEIAKKASSIHLIISSDPISHQDILEAISSADLGIISYQENEVNKNKIPTKLYEYSRAHLSFLIQKNTKWSQEGKSLGGAIPIDFSTPDITFIFDQVKKRESLFPKIYPKESTWEAQESTILHSIENLIK